MKRRGVDDGDHAAVDQRLGGRPVEVEVVDDRDVTGPQAAERARLVRRSSRTVPVTPGRPSTAGLAGGEFHGPIILTRSGNRSREAAGCVTDVGSPVRPVQPAARDSCAAAEQLLGVRQRGVGVLQPGEHPGQLADPALVVEDGQPRGGDRAVVCS